MDAQNRRERLGVDGDLRRLKSRADATGIEGGGQLGVRQFT